jgi:hypothetical protein
MRIQHALDYLGQHWGEEACMAKHMDNEIKYLYILRSDLHFGVLLTVSCALC